MMCVQDHEELHAKALFSPCLVSLYHHLFPKLNQGRMMRCYSYYNAHKPQATILRKRWQWILGLVWWCRKHIYNPYPRTLDRQVPAQHLCRHRKVFWLAGVPICVVSYTHLSSSGADNATRRQARVWGGLKVENMGRELGRKYNYISTWAVQYSTVEKPRLETEAVLGKVLSGPRSRSDRARDTRQCWWYFQYLVLYRSREHTFIEF